MSITNSTRAQGALADAAALWYALHMLPFELWTWSLAIGAALAVLGVCTLASDASPDSAFARFPRNVWAGRILAALALLWSGWVLHAMPLEFLLPVQKWIWPAMIACIPLAWLSMPDLLSCRATGGILCLLPAPVLQVARFHPSQMRLAVVVLMYVFAVAGMVFVMYPYLMRNAMSWLSAGKARMSAAGGVMIAVGAFLAILALGVFRG